MKNFWVAVVGVMAILCLAGGIASLGGDDEPTAVQTPAPVEASKPVATTKPPPATKPPPEKTTKPKPPPPEPKWTTVVTFSGNANKQSAPFQLSGERVRMTYGFTDNTGHNTIAGAIYVEPEGHDLRSEGGFPVVSVSESGSDTTELTRDAGSYYVSVMSANSGWTVTIEELK